MFRFMDCSWRCHRYRGTFHVVTLLVVTHCWSDPFVVVVDVVVVAFVVVVVVGNKEPLVNVVAVEPRGGMRREQVLAPVSRRCGGLGQKPWRSRGRASTTSRDTTWDGWTMARLPVATPPLPLGQHLGAPSPVYRPMLQLVESSQRSSGLGILYVGWTTNILTGFPRGNHVGRHCGLQW